MIDVKNMLNEVILNEHINVYTKKDLNLLEKLDITNYNNNARVKYIQHCICSKGEFECSHYLKKCRLYL